MTTRLLLVGDLGDCHVGNHFRAAAEKLGIPLRTVETREAYRGSPLWRRLNWWLAGRRPTQLQNFSREVVSACREWKPTVLLSTGVAPLTREALETIGSLGIQRMNFLTDDPWNPAHRAPWFFRALPLYDIVFTPRTANIDDLKSITSARIVYLPFAYREEMHFPEGGPDSKTSPDIFFAGGGDADRLPIIEALLDANFSIELYGSGWEKFRRTKSLVKGIAEADLIRRLVSTSKVSLCVVRRANRDGHSMRTYEAPAMKGCLLVEDTEEHRDLFGKEGRNVMYFHDLEQLVGKAKALVDSPKDRERLRAAAYSVIVPGNSYVDRLSKILSFTNR